jgi:SAM-dependent methyltransferase
MVRDEHAQSEAMRPADEAPPADHWRPYAENFRTDPRRAADPLLDHLLQQVSPGQTLIDVGAGGGRLALPLALHCESVTAVEPSESMVDVLESQARQHEINNVSTVHARWEDAVVEPADVVLSVHVVYVVQDIGTFIRKMDARANSRAVVVLYESAPMSRLYPLWRQVHGSERLSLPAAPQLREVLDELGISYRQDVIPGTPGRGYESPEHALDQISRRLYLAVDDPKREKLAQVLESELEDVEGAWKLKGDTPVAPLVLSWSPGAG